MRFQIVRTRPGFGIEERLHVYADKPNADLWLTDQGAVTDSQGVTVLVAEENGVIWNYHVEEIADAEEKVAPEPSTAAPRARSRSRRGPKTTGKTAGAGKPPKSKSARPARS